MCFGHFSIFFLGSLPTEIKFLLKIIHCTIPNYQKIKICSLNILIEEKYTDTD